MKENEQKLTKMTRNERKMKGKGKENEKKQKKTNKLNGE